MTLATGVFKQVSIKREVTYGTAPGASGFQLLRRVQSTIDLSKDTYQSNEIRPDLQTADFRHGVRRVKGSIQGELSPGTYSDQISACLKKDFAAGANASAVSLTIAGAGPYTVTRAAGDYLANGFKIGDVIRLTVGGLNANNLNKNLLITALTATVATVVVLNATAMTAEGPIAGCTVTVQGKKSYIPTTGHTDVSYALEHWYNDITQGELFTGIKFDKASFSLPPTGMATVTLDALGQNITTATSRYGTSPTAVTTKGVVAAVNGVLLVNSTQQAIVTGLQFTIDPTLSGDPVVGSNTVPNLFPGRVSVTGQFTAYFQDATMRDLFINETESSLVVALTTDNTATADVIVFAFPRIKVGGASKSDGEAGLVQTFPFTALYNTAGGSGISTEQTTISVQDSAA